LVDNQFRHRAFVVFYKSKLSFYGFGKEDALAARFFDSSCMPNCLNKLSAKGELRTFPGASLNGELRASLFARRINMICFSGTFTAKECLKQLQLTLFQL
jgi:hypothetical protein